MADHRIQSSIFNVDIDGSIDFLINKKTAVQNLVKVSALSRRDLELKNLRCPGIKPGSTAWKAAMLTTIPPTL